VSAFHLKGVAVKALKLSMRKLHKGDENLIREVIKERHKDKNLLWLDFQGGVDVKFLGMQNSLNSV
jgi:hypothetical protein